MATNIINVDADLQTPAESGTAACDRFVFDIDAPIPSINNGDSTTQAQRIYSVTNFENGSDVLDLTELGITSFDELTQLPLGGANPGVVFQGTAANGDAFIISVAGLMADQVSDDDFIFASTEPEANIVNLTVNANEFVGGTDGADVFVLAPNDASTGNTPSGIVNFQDGVDKIDVSALGITSFAELSGIATFQAAGTEFPGGLTTEEGQTVNAAFIEQGDDTTFFLPVYFLGETGTQTLLDESDFIFA